MLQPSEILPVISDTIIFFGHAAFLASLKRRAFLKPDIAVVYQSVCSKSVTTFLFVDEFPKHIKDIREVNKITKKTVLRTSVVRRTSDYKSSSNNFKYSQRGQKPFLGSRGHRAHFEQRQIDLLQASVDEVVDFLSQSSAEGKSYSTVNT